MIYNFDKILPKTVRAVKRAARIMKRSFTSERKGDAANIVTSADTAIEAYLDRAFFAIAYLVLFKSIKSSFPKTLSF